MDPSFIWVQTLRPGELSASVIKKTARSKLAQLACLRTFLLHCGVLPHKISTLLYCFNERDEALLLERRQEPNLGLWSPCGGKLKTAAGESPYACARREAHEEIGLSISATDLHLTGLISEHGYEGRAHWLMFLFEVKKRLAELPPPHREGRFGFFTAEALDHLPLPQTDREQIWPLFWRHRGGFFAAHCHCHADGRNEWTLQESLVR
jgi:8-oxo-dGTP diphosphatase